MSTFRHVAVAVVVVLFAPTARAEDDEAVKHARASGRVLTDGKGHFLVFEAADPAAMGEETRRHEKVWYGDGKTLFRTFTPYPSVHSTTSWSIDDLRVGEDTKSSMVMFGPPITLHCDDRKTELTAMPDADARALLAKATFKPPLVDRRAFAIGRDGTTYYYVDGGYDDTKKARLFVGKRGAMKEQKITRFATDTRGVSVTTTKGVLVSTRSWTVRPEARDRTTDATLSLTWTPKGGKPMELADLDPQMNARLIYADLGIYPARIGAPCDDL